MIVFVSNMFKNVILMGENQMFWSFIDKLFSTGVVSSCAEIWFLDRALYWHFLTDTFTGYYRLMLIHLGLPQWQYALTKYGISPQAKVGTVIFNVL